MTGPEARARRAPPARARRRHPGRPRTVADDDPELTCRLPGLASRSPRRVVLARRFRRRRRPSCSRRPSRSRHHHSATPSSLAPPLPQGVEVQAHAAGPDGAPRPGGRAGEPGRRGHHARCWSRAGRPLRGRFSNAGLVDEAVIGRGTEAWAPRAARPIGDSGLECSRPGRSLADGRRTSDRCRRGCRCTAVWAASPQSRPHDHSRSATICACATRSATPSTWCSTRATATTSTRPASSSCAPPCRARRMPWTAPSKARRYARSSSGRRPARFDDMLEVSIRAGRHRHHLVHPGRRDQACRRRPISLVTREDLRARRLQDLEEARDRAAHARCSGGRRRRYDRRPRGYRAERSPSPFQMAPMLNPNSERSGRGRPTRADVVFSAHVHRHHHRHRRGRGARRGAASRSARSYAAAGHRASAPRSPATAPA